MSKTRSGELRFQLKQHNTALIPVLIGAIQEQQKQIAALKLALDKAGIRN